MLLHMCSEGSPDGMSHGAEQDHGIHANQRGINQKINAKWCPNVMRVMGFLLA